MLADRTCGDHRSVADLSLRRRTLHCIVSGGIPCLGSLTPEWLLSYLS